MNVASGDSENRPTMAGGAAAAPAQASRPASGMAAITLPADVLPILPVRNMVLFPGIILPIAIGRERSIAAAQFAVKRECPLGVLMQIHPDSDAPGEDDLARTGTVASILRYVSAADGTHHVICQGEQRFRVLGYVAGYPFMAARVARMDEPAADGETEVEARFLQLRERAVEVLQLLPQASQEMVHAVQAIESPGALADMVAGYLDIKPEEKQELLELPGLRDRLDRLLHLIAHRLQVLQISRDIEQRTKASIGSHEREYVLREQMKAIQKELGDGTGNKVELEALRNRIIDAAMPEDVAKQATRELERLERMSDASAEYAMLRTYLDWLAELPWKMPQPDAIDLQHARAVLDADHFGLDKVKRRILEFLAVRKLNPLGHGPILCFVGPPGIGKTSLGQSIAKAMGRPFVRVSLGGLHDEAELRGHRRTYVGALPGSIIQGMKKAGARNCVMMLDEIDKVGSGVHGDPASALLETLDPEQNVEFLDHYLDLRLDLSKVLFVCTANTLDSIPGPLLDRMEVIRLSGYITEEKLAIAKRHLWPRLLERTGVPRERLTISDSAMKAVIEGYAREAGVRQLEKQLGKVVRKAVVRLLEQPDLSLKVTPRDLEDYLGHPVFRSEQVLSGVGVITGLAWTSMGGATLPIEATRIHTLNRGFKLTGKLGEVMKESVEIAYSYVSSHLKDFKGDPTFFDEAFVHLHVPEGATSKDGPSAGITMASALLSLARNQPPKKGVAMTGELTLTGHVLPIGGVREKVIAARRQKIFELILPEPNRSDFDELPDYLKEGLTVHFAKRFADVARVLF